MPIACRRSGQAPRGGSRLQPWGAIGWPDERGLARGLGGRLGRAATSAGWPSAAPSARDPRGDCSSARPARAPRVAAPIAAARSFARQRQHTPKVCITRSLARFPARTASAVLFIHPRSRGGSSRGAQGVLRPGGTANHRGPQSERSDTAENSCCRPPTDGQHLRLALRVQRVQRPVRRRHRGFGTASFATAARTRSAMARLARTNCVFRSNAPPISLPNRSPECSESGHPKCSQTSQPGRPRIRHP